MEFYTLASGSSGNCSLVCAGDTLLLIDAGISCRRIEQSLRALGRTLGDLTAVFITHEHADHVGGLATLSKKSAAPVYVTRGVSHLLTCPVVAFTAGDTLEFAGCTVRSFSTSHDAVDPVGYRVDAADGSLCDARFSKCCGGVTEKFENCWEPVPHSYLTALRDGETPAYPDLTDEREAEQWIRTSPEAFCNTADKEILSQVLNNYDQETTDFYRWKVEYTQEELSGLIHRKTGMDFGPIIDLVPLERGSSGRITKLKIVGVRRSFTIGKELEIRRTLSETHLYSSAFVVDKKDIRLDIPSRFILTGAGWGHGVGLCQIGAAVMGAKGYSYRKILTHYFPGASIEKRY